MNNKFTFAIGVTAGVLVATSAGLIAATGLTTFTAGTPAKASEVNANFTALSDRITALEAKLASVSVIGSTVRFTGVNVQVVNGMGTTATANGTGNLIVGYDEADTSGFPRCDLGTNPISLVSLNPANCVANGGTVSTTGFKTGSHYLVVGTQHNYSRWGGVLSGFRNTSNSDFAGVSGGYGNTASGQYASVNGGIVNTASGNWASVSGGQNNTASGTVASASGGDTNTASGPLASVSGGQTNTASGHFASVSGGQINTASGDYSSGSGGQGLTAGVVNCWRAGSLAGAVNSGC